MLKRIYSPVFIENGSIRPPVEFKHGLNVVLGKEDGENSIGKSSFLLAIDFVFGGDTYIRSDGVEHIGDHDVFFSFEFLGKEYHFVRSTSDPEIVTKCHFDKIYTITDETLSKPEYIDWLKKNYEIDFMDLSFRLTVSSFFRIYGKKNYDELRPLQNRAIPGMQKAIDLLLKLYDRYKDIAAMDGRFKEQKEKLSVYNSARKYDFVSRIVGGNKQYEDNQRKIRDLENQLELLRDVQAGDYTEEDIEKSQIKADLKNEKIVIDTELETARRRLKLLELSLEYGLYPKESDLEGLLEYFPNVNIRKLYEVEKYHNKLASILADQFEEEKEVLKGKISELEQRLADVSSQLRKYGSTNSLSREFLDTHGQILGEINALTRQNDAYLMQRQLEDQKRQADSDLKRSIASVLDELQTILNQKMEEYNDTLFPEKRKPPHIFFNGYNSYSFETPDDKGTGSNYKGMVIFDLAVLSTSALPAISHDSIILKNVSDGSIDGIMNLYNSFDKQIFIAFDKHSSYRPNTIKVLENNCVLRLSDNGGELYGESWNKEKGNNNTN